MRSNRLVAVLVGLLALASTADAGSVTLTDDNFDAEVFSGKNAIVKFQAPW
jgi:hypothetical protein